jgi:hypothetical protein
VLWVTIQDCFEKPFRTGKLSAPQQRDRVLKYFFIFIHGA